MGRVAVAAGAAGLEVLVAATALVVRIAFDGQLLRMAGRADVAAVGSLAHEGLHLGGRAIGLRADVTDDDSIRAAVDGAARTLGSLDILVNNAGVTSTTGLLELTPDDWDLVMGTNLKGNFLSVKACLPALKNSAEENCLLS